MPANIGFSQDGGVTVSPVRSGLRLAQVAVDGFSPGFHLDNGVKTAFSAANSRFSRNQLYGIGHMLGFGATE